MQPNPSTGQLTAVFNRNPQLPFSDLNLKFFSGPLAALANPETCGTFTTTSTISAYGSATSEPVLVVQHHGVRESDAVRTVVHGGHDEPDRRRVLAVHADVLASDTDKELSRITATLPPGLFAKIAGVHAVLERRRQRRHLCPASSQVGTATVGSGAGSHPIFLTGQVYLTGPYNGGAYGLATVVPAVAGPYNLGTVVVRQALDINPNDAHVTAVSDPFPTILDGVPLRIKTVNLTSTGRTSSSTRRRASRSRSRPRSRRSADRPRSVSSPFQVGVVRGLPFTPTLGISLSGQGPDEDRQASDADCDVDGRRAAVRPTSSRPRSRCR